MDTGDSLVLTNFQPDTAHDVHIYRSPVSGGALENCWWSDVVRDEALTDQAVSGMRLGGSTWLWRTRRYGETSLKSGLIAALAIVCMVVFVCIAIGGVLGSLGWFGMVRLEAALAGSGMATALAFGIWALRNVHVKKHLFTSVRHGDDTTPRFEYFIVLPQRLTHQVEKSLSQHTAALRTKEEIQQMAWNGAHDKQACVGFGTARVRQELIRSIDVQSTSKEFWTLPLLMFMVFLFLLLIALGLTRAGSSYLEGFWAGAILSWGLLLLLFALFFGLGLTVYLFTAVVTGDWQASTHWDLMADVSDSRKPVRLGRWTNPRSAELMRDYVAHCIDDREQRVSAA